MVFAARPVSYTHLEVFASVQENDGLYQPVYEVAGLPGAVYDVIADEDIYTGDGTLRAEKDTVVETLTTGEDLSLIHISLIPTFSSSAS